MTHKKPHISRHSTHIGTQRGVALETTLLVHGIPHADAPQLATQLAQTVRDHNATPYLVGVHQGTPTVGLSDAQLADLLDAASADPASVPKVNAANLGLAIACNQHAATTVSATMQLAAAAGIRALATGGIGGIHPPPAPTSSSPHSHSSPSCSQPTSTTSSIPLDISADLHALANIPVAVVCSGVKSILDVVATRELLESLAVPVIGYQTDDFPAFYFPDSGATVDARFDDVQQLADYVRYELARHNRGILICNPPPAEHTIDRDDWDQWLTQANDEARAQNISGRDVTPFVLGRLHELSNGQTLRANLALVRANAALAAQIAASF